MKEDWTRAKANQQKNYKERVDWAWNNYEWWDEANSGRIHERASEIKRTYGWRRLNTARSYEAEWNGRNLKTENHRRRNNQI